MEQIDLTNKPFVILGLQGSGKTVLAHHILSLSERHIVYDPLGEYTGFRRYIPENRHSIAELEGFVRGTVIPWQPDIFVLDEAPLYIPKNPKPLSTSVSDLCHLSRHFGISWGSIARRPTSFHTDVIEIAYWLFVFKLAGKNDRQHLNNIYNGMGDVVANLPKHHFAVLEAGTDLTVHSPVPYVGS